MVQVNFETVTQAESCIAPNHLPGYGQDHIMFKLVAATQTNAKHLILYVPSIANSQNHQISNRHVID